MIRMRESLADEHERHLADVQRHLAAEHEASLSNAETAFQEQTVRLMESVGDS